MLIYWRVYIIIYINEEEKLQRFHWETIYIPSAFFLHISGSDISERGPEVQKRGQKHRTKWGSCRKISMLD